MIQPMCVMSMPGCRALRLALVVESSAAQPAWIALYHDWAIAGSFAFKNADCFLSADTTSKYLHTHTDRGKDEGKDQITYWHEVGGGVLGSFWVKKQMSVFTINNISYISSFNHNSHPGWKEEIKMHPFSSSVCVCSCVSLPVLCVWWTLLAGDMAHFQWDGSGLLHDWVDLLLWCRGQRVQKRSTRRRILKKCRHLFYVFYYRVRERYRERD